MAIEFRNGIDIVGFTRPTPTPTPTPSVTPTVTPTITITPSVTPSVTPTVTVTSSSVSLTQTPTVTPTNSITPTNTVTPTPTPTPTPTATDSGGLVYSGLIFNLQTAPSTGTTWTDVSGNGRSATLQGTPTYVSNNGGGIKLNNTAPNGVGNDYISVPYNISSNTVTVEVVASFNPDSFWATIWGNEIYNDSGGYLAYVNSSTEISFGIPNNETAVTITQSNTIRHWIFVINGTQASLFLNGSQVGTTNTIGNQTLFATNDFYFGARHNNNGIDFGGDTMNNSNSANYPVFYQMRVYNRSLSGSEITANFNSIRGTYGL